MSLLEESKFEMQGQFTGFIRDECGKRRMLLRAGEESILFKLPTALRKQLGDRLVPGHAIVVSGVEQRDPLSGWVRRIISRLHFLDESVVSSHCTVRVCAKKNCWKNGGKELWQALEQKIASAGLTDVVRLKAVGCLDRCKRAPNLDCGSTQLERCTPEMARALIDELARD
ncbi:MAG: NADH:ubiquinone oxidoreductase 24 kD subunit [Chthoniobacteraceae bacterium]|nr:NADH:ubiquinone oxidoreductase 24 kD subunit [Chthoniobacteraceae bacterium]